MSPVRIIVAALLHGGRIRVNVRAEQGRSGGESHSLKTSFLLSVAIEGWAEQRAFEQSKRWTIEVVDG